MENEYPYYGYPNYESDGGGGDDHARKIVLFYFIVIGCFCAGCFTSVIVYFLNRSNFNLCFYKCVHCIGCCRLCGCNKERTSRELMLTAKVYSINPIAYDEEVDDDCSGGDGCDCRCADRSGWIRGHGVIYDSIVV